ncbi:hypothetical protein [Psychroserpens sp. MEBiC05023]
MLKLFKVLILYAVYGLIVGEIVVRLFGLTSDIPQRTITKDYIQKYIPNQSGGWSDGNHKWQVNNRGWAGPLPDSFDNLITIVGDSFIENLMNPDECHQSYYLKQNFPKQNFLEAARSGVTFIESFEITKHLDSLQPKYQIICLNDYNIKESISNIEAQSDITQFNTEKQEFIYGKMKAPFAKKILYNWKFMYYLYNRFPINFKKQDDIPKVDTYAIPYLEQYNKEFRSLLDYVVANYTIEDKILVLKPTATKGLANLLEAYGFKVVVLDDHGEDWTFGYDAHWNCYGHEEASKQITKALKSLNL